MGHLDILYWIRLLKTEVKSRGQRVQVHPPGRVTEWTIPDGLVASPLAAAALALAHFQADPPLPHCTCELLTSFQCTWCARTSQSCFLLPTTRGLGAHTQGKRLPSALDLASRAVRGARQH